MGMYSLFFSLCIFVLPFNNEAFSVPIQFSHHSKITSSSNKFVSFGSTTAVRNIRCCHHHRSSARTTIVTRANTSTTNNHPTPKNEYDNIPTTTTSLPQYLRQTNVDQELSRVICATASACTAIAKELSRLPIINAAAAVSTTTVNVQGEVQKGMDVVANHIVIDRVGDTVAALASEEETNIIVGQDTSSKYEIAFDPLDGSSNLDVSVPTGTIFGIAPHTPNAPFSTSGRSIVAAGYTVYSSSVELVISFGPSGSNGAARFTLDPNLIARMAVDEEEKDTDTTDNKANNNNNKKQLIEEQAACFILSRPNLTCPPNGPYYSLNEAREPDWPAGLRQWIHDAKRGDTPSQTIFSSRYICSLCADVHRTILKGGWAGNPRPHLRLLYEAAPLAHVLEACGGYGSDGVGNLLDIVPPPGELHCRVPVFLGSINDIYELIEYGDMQQSAAVYKT